MGKRRNKKRKASKSRVPDAHPESEFDDTRFLLGYNRRVMARYDAAQTTPENEAHWANADNLSPWSAASPGRRKRIRSRARYEAIESNSIAKGMVSTVVNDTIGRGPTVQIGTRNREWNRFVEREFSAWSEVVDLAAHVRSMRGARCVDGETFAQPITNDQLPTPVLLDLLLTEADYWTNPSPEIDLPNWEDGIRYNAVGKPVSYRRLRHHPGTDHFFHNPLEFDDIPASEVIHWFRRDRPGQRRGISELAPALPLFAELRRFTLAVIAAAETAADHAGVVRSTAVAFSEEPEAFDEKAVQVPIRRRSLITLPRGWDITQLRAEQPSTSYDMFVDRILMEVARCLQMPLNIASGSSRRHNFASGRLDYLLWWNACDVDRQSCERMVLDRIFDWWLDEAFLIPGYLPPLGESLTRVPRSWQFPARRPIDPVADAKRIAILWGLGLHTDEQFFQESSIDPDMHYEQLARMYERRTSIHPNTPIPGVQMSESVQPDDDDGQDQVDTDDEGSGSFDAVAATYGAAA